MGFYLNIKMLFSLPRVHTFHMNEHEATVLHPGLMINSDSFLNRFLDCTASRFLLSFPEHVAGFPLGNQMSLQKSATSTGMLDMQWPLQHGPLHWNSIMSHDNLQEVTMST